MEIDVILLTDVFENFRNLCLHIYGLDPAHFCTAPGLSWQVVLKMTGVNLELLTDPDMHLFIERELRGGIVMISKRYAKANNPYVNDYNLNQPSNYLIYIDANNLYGWSVSQALPTQRFRWLSRQEIDSYDVFKAGENAEQGYILSVNMEYPAHLHDIHSDYPLAPESFEVKSDILSPYQQNLLRKLDLGENSNKKILPNLYNERLCCPLLKSST